MTNFDPARLQEGKRRKAEERQREEERQRLADEAAEAREIAAAQKAAERMARERDLRDRHSQLTNYVDGIYEEVSKISTKWPTHLVNELTVDRTNSAIREAKSLLADDGDLYVGDIKELVPAGDLPEYRDVAMTLRQVKDALKRMESRHRHAWQGYRS